MNCLRKKLTSIILLLSLFFAIFPSTAFADYTSIALSPSTGTIYADYTALSLTVNSGTDEFIGVDVNIAFTGSVQFLEATGASRCSSFNTTAGTGTLNVECLSTAHAVGETYNGVVATLYFKSTGTGTSTFTFSSTDPNITTKTGGTYTLSTASNPVPRDSGSGDDTLPDSGLFDDTRGVIVVGIVLMAFGIFFNHINRFALSLITTAKLNKEKREEERIEKRRGKLEKKF
jgi:hypothetical protein